MKLKNYAFSFGIEGRLWFHFYKFNPFRLTKISKLHAARVIAFNFHRLKSFPCSLSSSPRLNLNYIDQKNTTKAKSSLDYYQMVN